MKSYIVSNLVNAIVAYAIKMAAAKITSDIAVEIMAKIIEIGLDARLDSVEPEDPDENHDEKHLREILENLIEEEIDHISEQDFSDLINWISSNIQGSFISQINEIKFMIERYKNDSLTLLRTGELTNGHAEWNYQINHNEDTLMKVAQSFT